MTRKLLLVKRPSALSDNGKVNTLARWGLVVLSGILVLMQMSSSMTGVYDITILISTTTTTSDVDATTASLSSSTRSSGQSSILSSGGRKETSEEAFQRQISSSFTNNKKLLQQPLGGSTSSSASTTSTTSNLQIDLKKERQAMASTNTTTTTATKTKTSNNNILEPPHPIDSKTIRKWGCNRNEAPFIFVHIGKAGGGGVRARIAASAVDYNRGSMWMKPQQDNSYYYPIMDNDNTTGKIIIHKGKLSHSESPNMLPQFEGKEWDFPFQRTFRFEKSYPCHATTPLGHAIACHLELNICNKHHPNEGEKDIRGGDRCDLVYMGHNVLGGEMNFLPTQYLLNWWTNTTWGQNNQKEDDNHNNNNNIATRLANRYIRSHRIGYPEKLNPNRRKCVDGSLKKLFYNKLYERCIYPEARIADIAALSAVGGVNNNRNTTTKSGGGGGDADAEFDNNNNNNKKLLEEGFQTNWGPLYASMPILRVTMLREPFSWLKSKFFWMNDHMNTRGEPGKVIAHRGAMTPRLQKFYASDEIKREKYKDAEWVRCDDVDNFTQGWGKQGALEYIFYLCGEHCMGQWHAIQEAYGGGDGDPKLLRDKHLEHLKAMEEQAAYNLRNSFAVVGLLTETPDFYSMISKRVQYMDTSLNPWVRGESHSSGRGPEQQRCSEVFKREAFRKEIMDKGPEIAVAVRLYELGVEVNKFQKEELDQCPP